MVLKIERGVISPDRTTRIRDELVLIGEEVGEMWGKDDRGRVRDLGVVGASDEGVKAGVFLTREWGFGLLGGVKVTRATGVEVGLGVGEMGVTSVSFTRKALTDGAMATVSLRKDEDQLLRLTFIGSEESTSKELR